MVIARRQSSGTRGSCPVAGGVIYRVQRATRSVCTQFLGTESLSLQAMAYWHTESAMDCATVPMVLIISFDYSLETNRLV